ncbi:hypothetical protein EVAR_38452_1 [Eumeta japonica]|uniref:Uncharacterized protein n=1 Tax=Eumeta variegata TaxID=151549 RepID=A0A4C1X0M4_EUMVA|nr:hypothetical protein EVAR_38452_1 [Eumeta japonica]
MKLHSSPFYKRFKKFKGGSNLREERPVTTIAPCTTWSQMMKVGFIVTILKRQSPQWAFPFEETKVKSGRSAGKKIVVSFCGIDRGNRKTQSESEYVALERMRVVYLLQASARKQRVVSNIPTQEGKERKIHKGGK